MLYLCNCRLVTYKGNANYSEEALYRCGVFYSFIYSKGIKKEVYPDLGLVLANRSLLKLTDKQAASIDAGAKLCEQVCEDEKEHIRIIEENLKEKLTSNSIKGDMTKVSFDLNMIQDFKKKWLRGHEKRYQKGISVLNKEQLKKWKVIEQNVRKFPK